MTPIERQSYVYLGVHDGCGGDVRLFRWGAYEDRLCSLCLMEGPDVRTREEEKAAPTPKPISFVSQKPTLSQAPAIVDLPPSPGAPDTVPDLPVFVPCPCGKLPQIVQVSVLGPKGYAWQVGCACGNQIIFSGEPEEAIVQWNKNNENARLATKTR